MAAPEIHEYVLCVVAFLGQDRRLVFSLFMSETEIAMTVAVVNRSFSCPAWIQLILPNFVSWLYHFSLHEALLRWWFCLLQNVVWILVSWYPSTLLCMESLWHCVRVTNFLARLFSKIVYIKCCKKLHIDLHIHLAIYHDISPYAVENVHSTWSIWTFIIWLKLPTPRSERWSLGLEIQAARFESFLGCKVHFSCNFHDFDFFRFPLLRFLIANIGPLAVPRSPARLLFPILAVAFVSLFTAAYAAGVKYMPAVLAPWQPSQRGWDLKWLDWGWIGSGGLIQQRLTAYMLLSTGWG